MSNTTSTSKGAYPGGTKIYKALLNQSGANPPVATILTNTLGVITWTYDSVSRYFGTLTGAFTANKTWLAIPFADLVSGNTVQIRRIDSNQIRIDIVDGADGRLTNTPIEIIVYP